VDEAGVFAIILAVSARLFRLDRRRQLRSIVAKGPTTLPITMMVISVCFCIWLASAARR
jgi:hypothetical protein